MYMYLFLMLFSSCIHSEDDLTLLGRKYNTDKSNGLYQEGIQGSGHNYTAVYDAFFHNMRYEKLKFLEIGFYQGSSARMWRDYFINAELHFIDIHEKWFTTYGQDLQTTCTFHVVDQSSAYLLQQFITKEGGYFNIIIDDGGHTMEQQITSFIVLFPHLTSGGIYVIEDLHSSYHTSWGGAGDWDHPNADGNTTIRFLQKLIDDLNYISSRTLCADIHKCPSIILDQCNIYQKQIKSIHFFRSLCFIIKQ